MASLEFVDVGKSYGATRVLAGVNFSLEPGAIVGLIGDNGAGKTTLLRLAAKILRPTDGVVRVLGETDALAARRRLGAFLERPGHYDEISVEENLRFFLSFYEPDPATLDRLVARALEQFGLVQVRAAAPGRLSTGYRQRLAVARAAHPWAEVVLLDEPLESLDPVARAQLKELLVDLKREGRAIMVSSHGLADLARIADRLLLVMGGTVRAFDGFAAIQQEIGLEPTDDLDVLYTRLRARMTSREVH